MSYSIKNYTDKIPLFYGISIAYFVLGGFGIATGLWVQFFRPSTSGELMINRTLILFSIGATISGLVHFRSFRIIKMLADQRQL